MQYGTIEKMTGETPLVALERFRIEQDIPKDTPLAYAGRLDPMASGTLLILIGDECKVQEKYHSFDKEYEVEVLLGVSSDTGDVLGLLTQCNTKTYTLSEINTITQSLIGIIELPYPKFSSRTVQGKPLHTWTLEHRLHEITIPIKRSNIYTLTVTNLSTVSKETIVNDAQTRIETIPKVTDERKILGADFRRDTVRDSWNTFEKTGAEAYQILSFTCIASSGTYMRSLAEEIGARLGTCGLAYSIHRTKIGRYLPLWGNYGIWTRKF